MDMTGASASAGMAMSGAPEWAEMLLRWALASPFAYSAISKGLNASLKQRALQLKGRWSEVQINLAI